MIFEDKPDDATFMFAKDELTEKWRDAHSDWQHRDELYQRKFKVWADDEQRSSYTPSTATSIIDHASDTQLAFTPTVKRPPAHPDNNQSVELADRIERTLKAGLDDASEKEVELPFKMAGKFMLHLGYGVLELGWDEDDREGQEGRQYNPIRLRAPHPASILMDPDEKSPPLAIKLMSLKAWQLQNWTEKLKDKGADVEPFLVRNFNKGNPFADIPLEYMWTHRWTMLKNADGGRPLFIMENPWQIMPFTHAYAGYGMEMTDPELRDPLTHAKGLLSVVADTLVVEAQAASAKHQLLIDKAYAQEGSSLDPQEVARMRERGILTGDKEDFWILDKQGLDASLFRVGEDYQNELALGTYNRTLIGERQRGVDTVGQQAMSTQAAAKKFLVPAVQVQHMSSVTASNALRLLHASNTTLKVNGMSFTPNMLENDFSVQVTFEDVDPVLAIQKREVGMREVAAGLKSKDRYWREDANISDITAERDALDRDLLDMQPALIRQRERRAAAKMGEDLDAALAEVEEEEARRQAETQARRNGTTDSGGGALNLSGLRGPNPDVPSDINLLTDQVAQPPRIPVGLTGA